jgi:hypothetical protein
MKISQVFHLFFGGKFFRNSKQFSSVFSLKNLKCSTSASHCICDIEHMLRKCEKLGQRR